MPDESPEVEELLLDLKSGKPLAAMLAPSFPVIFDYPQIVGKLKRLGFKYIVEVACGAQETNNQLLSLLKQNPKRKYITSPCSNIVRLIREKYTHLVKYLAQTDSPMSATVKIVKKKYPGFRPVFIGPCPIKKLEAKEDWPELNILVLTYREIIEVFDKMGIKDDASDKQADFDLQHSLTRLYPISGGLSESSYFNRLLTDEEYDVISGPKMVEQSLNEFPRNRLRVLDILACDGGCINNISIPTTLVLSQRRQKVIDYWNRRL